MVLVRMCEEKVPQLQAVLLDDLHDQSRLPASVEQRRFACELVPNEETVHGVAALGRADLPQFIEAALGARPNYVPARIQWFVLRSPTQPIVAH